MQEFKHIDALRWTIQYFIYKINFYISNSCIIINQVHIMFNYRYTVYFVRIWINLDLELSIFEHPYNGFVRACSPIGKTYNGVVAAVRIPSRIQA